MISFYYIQLSEKLVYIKINICIFKLKKYLGDKIIYHLLFYCHTKLHVNLSVISLLTSSAKKKI
jgi:hypothetical protein